MDYKGRVYCTPKCADITLKREGIEDRLRYFGHLDEESNSHILFSQQPN